MGCSPQSGVPVGEQSNGKLFRQAFAQFMRLCLRAGDFTAKDLWFKARPDLFLLLRVTGIPLTEEQSLRSKGDAVLYATSQDGLHWEKPALGLFSFQGSTANNIVSFLSAAEMIEGGCLLLNSDIVVDPSVIEELAADRDGSWLVVDHDEPLGAEEMKVQLDEAGWITRVNKELQPEDCVGEYIGALRFDASGVRECLASGRRLVASGGTNLYYEHAIDAAAAEVGALPLPTAGRAWTEIDDMVDYARALEILAGLEGDGAR